MPTRLILSLIIILLWMFALPEVINCKRILVIAPSPVHSHQSVFRPLWLALHKRGHELVVGTSLPMNVTLSNYTEIDFNTVRNMSTKLLNDLQLSSSRQFVEEATLDIGRYITNEVFKNVRLRQLYALGSNEKFDALIIEAVLNPGIYSLACKFNAPLIGISSMDTYKYVRYLLGDSLLPSYPVNWEFDKTAGFNLPFWNRVANYVDMLVYLYRWMCIFIPQEEELARKYLGSDVSDLDMVMRNMSLLLLTQVISNAKPDPPNIVYFNGVHIKKKPMPLPEHLKQFLDDATKGFIYISFGNSIHFSLFTKEKLNMIVKAVAKLPYKVLWKINEENLPNKPDNVFTVKWTPQQAVLAHPNIKLFIYQGGLQSTDEAIHYGVPLIGIPILYDQGFTINRVVEKGVAKRLDFYTFTDEDLLTAIYEILDNEQYKKNMIRLSDIIKDKPVDSIEDVVWRIEYVMRHNGAPHLRFNGAHVSFFKRDDVDVIAFLAVTIFVITSLLLLFLINFLYFIVRKCHVLASVNYKAHSSNSVYAKEKAH